MLLKQTDISFSIAKRVTTREKRDSKEDDLSYDYVDHTTFQNMIINNELIEYHCYLFGMCYALPFANVEKLLLQQQHVIGIINLGNAKMVKKAYPNSFNILLTASLDTIRQRLEERQIHTPEQIEERLGNANRSFELVRQYDLVIYNENRSPGSIVQEIIDSYKKHNEKVKNYQI